MSEHLVLFWSELFLWVQQIISPIWNKSFLWFLDPSASLSWPAKYDTLRIRVMHNNLECPLVTDRSVLVLVSKTYGKYLHVIRCFVLSDCCNFRIVHVRWAWAPFYVEYNFVTQNYHISGGARCFDCFIVINLCSACRTYKKVFQFLSVNLFCRLCTELLICCESFYTATFYFFEGKCLTTCDVPRLQSSTMDQ